MKPIPLTLDRHIFELFQSGQFEHFTTRELRDAYANILATPDVRLADIRRYVYEQIRRLLKVGWIREDTQRRKRGQIYHLLSRPAHLELRLVNNRSEMALIHSCSEGEAPQASADSVTPAASTTHQLEALIKEIRLDFLASMGEAERYKQLLEDMPQLRERIENDYIEARDRSSRLLGHLRAVEKTLKTLAS
jgi:hypothetical protein